MSEFRNLVINQFNYLEQFGYNIVDEADTNSVNYRGKNNRVEVIFSSIGYELTCQFIDNADNYFTLQDGLEYKIMPEYKGVYQISSKDKMKEGILYLSQVVKKLFESINVSDPINFQKVYQFRIDTHKKMLEKYYVETDLKNAENYWEKKEYSKAKELFKKNIEYLSQSQLKKLEYIENNGIL